MSDVEIYKFLNHMGKSMEYRVFKDLISRIDICFIEKGEPEEDDYFVRDDDSGQYSKSLFRV